MRVCGCCAGALRPHVRARLERRGLRRAPECSSAPSAARGSAVCAADRARCAVWACVGARGCARCLGRLVKGTNVACTACVSRVCAARCAQSRHSGASATRRRFAKTRAKKSCRRSLAPRRKSLYWHATRPPDRSVCGCELPDAVKEGAPPPSVKISSRHGGSDRHARSSGLDLWRRRACCCPCAGL